MVIKVNESQKDLNLFELDWCGSISDGGDFLKIYTDAVDPNKKT